MSTTQINIIPGPPLTSRQRLAGWYMADANTIPLGLRLRCTNDAWDYFFGVRHNLRESTELRKSDSKRAERLANSESDESTKAARTDGEIVSRGASQPTRRSRKWPNR